MGIPEAVTPEVRKQSDLAHLSWVSPPSVVVGSDTTELGIVEKPPWSFSTRNSKPLLNRSPFPFIVLFVLIGRHQPSSFVGSDSLIDELIEIDRKFLQIKAHIATYAGQQLTKWAVERMTPPSRAFCLKAQYEPLELICADTCPPGPSTDTRILSHGLEAVEEPRRTFKHTLRDGRYARHGERRA